MLTNRYEVLLADESHSLGCHFRLRYRVYCLDKAYEDPSTFPDGQEVDEYDAYSVHFIACDRVTGEVVAGLRLVLPESPCFPCERIAGFDVTALTQLPRARIAEISRVCLLKSETPGLHLVAAHGQPARSLMRTSEMAVGLYRAAYAYTTQRGLSHWVGFTSPAMRRLLVSQNVELAAIGRAYQHRGERQAYLVHMGQGPALFGSTRMPAYVRASALLKASVA